jgi:ArsR family transcriptional regulator
MMNVEEQAVIFSALADPTRLKILRLLCNQQKPDALCVGALTGLVGISQPAVSQHLRVLKTIGLVKGERRGYHIHYSINPEAAKRCQKMTLVALSIEEPSEENLCQNCNEGRKQNVSRE